jgi:hypothetical protein
MYILNDQQIDYILNDIKVRGVEMEDLQLNLLDHVCCIIEYELEPGGNFENFYRNTIPRFFKKELKEIQEETTLLLTFKHYYAMKRTMNTVGIIASIGIVLGAIFRFQHWPGANVMLLLGVILISFVFLPLMFTMKLRESAEKRDKTILILGCVISILFVIATAFRLMHWPYANILLGVSVLSLLFIFVPVYLFTGLRNPVMKVNTIVNAVLIIAGSGLIMSLSTNRNLTKSGRDGIRVVYQRIQDNVNNVNEQNTAIVKSFPSGSLPAEVLHYLVISKNAREYIDRLKVNLIMMVERVPVEMAESLKIDQMIGLDESVSTTFFMLGPDNSGKTGNVVMLKAKLAELNTAYSLLTDAQKNHWTQNIFVGNENFKYVPMSYVMQELVELQYEIVNADKQLLNYYSAKL